MKTTLLIALLLLVGCTNTVMILDEPPFFSPATIEIEPGESITWDDTHAAVVHPVNAIEGPEKFSSGHFKQLYERTFEKPGLYHYICPIHPYMQGYIGVGVEVPEHLKPKLEWPPASAAEPVPGNAPEEPGKGEVWVDAQFETVDGKEKPGVIYVIDAATWKITHRLADNRINNPHNLMLTSSGKHILQTNWFDLYLSVIDRKTKEIVKHIRLGESPAHVMSMDDKAYITLQGDDALAVVDELTWERKKLTRTVLGEHEHGTEYAAPGTGPHGNWMSEDGTRMSLAHTEGGSISVWQVPELKKIFEHRTDPLPLMAGISADGTKVWGASLLTGNFLAFDVDTQEVLANYTIGKGPVQPVPDPDGKYILVALSGDGAVAIVDAKTFELVKTIPSGAGTHGVSYGPKANGGWYAYVTNKWVSWVTVVDMDTLDIAGYLDLPDNALGGQGILGVYG